MQARIKNAVAAGIAAALLAAIGGMAAFAGFFLAGAGVTAMHFDGRAVLPSPRAEIPLLHKVALKPEPDLPRRGFSTGDKRNIEGAVRAQLRAYVARDADGAFAKLAPSTQRFFGEPDRFLRSIAQEVPAMLDTKRFAFLGIEQAGKQILQQVLITDSNGQEWLAEFQLEQLDGPDWRIKGCILQSTPGQQA
jgi:hypothetical protein